LNVHCCVLLSSGLGVRMRCFDRLVVMHRNFALLSIVIVTLSGTERRAGIMCRSKYAPH